jgi:cobalt-zinc-cadmium efflux system outer membrane protein
MAFSWDLRASDARVVQAGLRPNPELSVNPENFVGSGDYRDRQQLQNTLQLSQLIELGDKRARRTEVAERTRDKSAVDYEAKRVEVLGATTLDFIAVVSDQERLTLAELATHQADELLHAVKKRIKAGVGSTLEQKRAEVQLARSKIAEDHARHQLLASRQNLAARWGGKSPIFTEARGELFTTHPVPPLDSIMGRLEASPERRAAIAEEKVLAAEAALARTKQTSDVTVGAGWRQGRSWDDQSTVAFVTIPLQVFNRYQGEVAQADALERKAKSSTSAVETRLRAVLFGLYQEILHAQDEVSLVRGEILPRSEEALALARSGFDQGLFTQLDLLDAQRTLLEVRSEYIQAGQTYNQLLAEIERLLGEPL